MSELGLVRYDAMCHAIEVCHRVDEAKEIRDRAKALAVYAKEAQNVEAERMATKIRIRAERRAGELLKQASKEGQRRSKTDGKSKVSRPAIPKPATLSELGISGDQSSDWQKLAEIPQPEFDATLQSQTRPTTDSVLLAGGKKSQPKIHFDRDALDAYGHITRFEAIMARPASELFGLMQDFQQERLKALLPSVIMWLKEMQ